MWLKELNSDKWKLYSYIILFHLIATVQVTFIPSLNIGVYQLALYQCSVNHPNSIIVWNVNRTISTNINIVQLGIVTIGTGTPTSSLNIPGYPQYNNTVVTCTAYGSVEGIKNATLRIQGIYKHLLEITTLLQLFSLSLSPQENYQKLVI